MNADEVQKVALSIMTYFRNNPKARDTAEGIAEWWVRSDREVVKQALDLLVRQKLVATSLDHFYFKDTK